MNDLTFSVIIPTLDAAKTLGRCLNALQAALPRAEIIAADGGSQDETVRIAQAAGVECRVSPPGRGTQCNAGARQARGDIFLFLHADTILSPQAASVLMKFFADPRVEVATFRLAFDHPHWLLKFYSATTIFDSVFTRFGDQGIAVRRHFFEAVGGFPDWPLFEDVHFLRLARAKTRIYSLPATVTTSAERFLRNGLIRQQLFNGALVFRYLFGARPEALARAYQQFTRRKP